MRWFATMCLAASLAVLAGCGSGDSPAGDEQLGRAARGGKVNVIIGFAGGPRAVPAAPEAVVAQAGGRITRAFRHLPYVTATVPAAAVERLKRQPGVSSVEPDGVFQATDAELDNTWGVKKIGSGTVHDGGNKGAGTTVAVLDTGCNYLHTDLDARFSSDPTERGYDFANNDSDPLDDNGHGTHVCGTVAAEDNATGVVGVAPEARLVALKVLNASGSGSFGWVMAALDWCITENRDGDATVINAVNCSFGAASNPGTAVEAAFDAAVANGIVCVAAAGNSGNKAGTGDKINWPAKYASVIAVGATDSSNRRASFSSTGPDLEVMAPGTNIRSTSRTGGYVSYNGTSMASPHVAGLAALVAATGVSDPAVIRQRLTSTCLELGAAGRDSLFGFGLVQAVAATAPPP